MSNPPTKSEESEPAAADHSKYLVHSRHGIVGILASLCKNASMITAYLDGGNDFILTAILAVRSDQDEVIADFGADADTNQRALQNGRLNFTAELYRIQIRFMVDILRKTSFEGHDAFSFSVPKTLLRLQRRESYRVSIPMARRLKCILGAEHTPSEVSIVDISCGGVAVIDANYPSDIEPGMYFRGCRILLPGSSEVVTDMHVRTVTELTLKNGVKQLRAGCEFIGMSGRDEAKIQFYVTKLEREDMARSSSMFGVLR